MASVNSKFDPNKLYAHQTWVKIAQGRTLMGANSAHAAGTTAEAGLPNITGSARPAITAGGYPLIVDQASGAFSKEDRHGYRATSVQINTNNDYKGIQILLDASKSNSIYGKSNTVQPPAYFVYYWRRTA